jgi:hypothetical protein
MGRTIVGAGLLLGGLIGAYLPVVLMHASAWGLTSFIGSTIGGGVGVWAGYKAFRYLDI